jgi:hypothetical protein
MRYTGNKFSAEEAEQIMREVRVRLRLRDESIRQQARGADIVYKTIDDARVPKRFNSTRWNNASQ